MIYYLPYPSIIYSPISETYLSQKTRSPSFKVGMVVCGFSFLNSAVLCSCLKISINSMSISTPKALAARRTLRQGGDISMPYKVGAIFLTVTEKIKTNKWGNKPHINLQVISIHCAEQISNCRSILIHPCIFNVGPAYPMSMLRSSHRVIILNRGSMFAFQWREFSPPLSSAHRLLP